MEPRFLQIHTLTSYPASLLNRDDVGFAKRIPFGDGSRTRISSQCLKRHWRRHEGQGSLAEIEGTSSAVRSRRTFDVYIRKPLEDSGVEPELANLIARLLMSVTLTGKASPKEPKELSPVHSEQVTVLGRPELEYLLGQGRVLAEQYAQAADADKKKPAAQLLKLFKEINKADWKKNLMSLRLGAGLDAALFGRMVTSDILARCDAAIHVAHAFTVHEQMVESDYFSAIDDLMAEAGETGSGHINSSQLTTGLFYNYVVVDLPLLVSNLEGCDVRDWRGADQTLCVEVVRRLVRIIATVSPGAKLGSTAPHSYASFVGLELGGDQPRTLANAFLKSVPTKSDVLGAAYRQLGDHVAELDAAYGAADARAGLVLGADKSLLEPAFGESRSMKALSSWIESSLKEVE